MSDATTICPHCGKQISSPDKLGWHLTRECPALVSIATNAQDEGETRTAPSSDNSRD